MSPVIEEIGGRVGHVQPKMLRHLIITELPVRIRSSHLQYLTLSANMVFLDGIWDFSFTR